MKFVRAPRFRWLFDDAKDVEEGVMYFAMFDVARQSGISEVETLVISQNLEPWHLARDAA